MTFGRIVGGVDAEQHAVVAATVAMLAATSEAQVDLVHAGADTAETQGLLERTAQLVVSHGIDAGRVSSKVQRGSAADVLVEVAEEVDAGLIVMGRGGRKPGRVAHSVSHRAPCDLLVAVEPRPPGAYGRILIASDGSATADRAARRGFDLARALDAAVDLVFVGHPSTGELVTQDTVEIYGDDVDAAVHLLEGDPAAEILRAAEVNETDLVVVGNKGLTGARGMLLASVPKDVFDGATSDVLICRTVRQIASQLAPGEGGVIERHGEQLAASVDESGELHLMSARCTHLGCTVAWNPADRTFDCPCHGSRFGPQGEVVNGPAGRPLPPA